MKILWFKRRDYPIKRDEFGHSLRQQAFELFNKGYRPARIFNENLVVASKNTLFRYFEDWKKQKHQLSRSMLRNMMKNNPEFTEKMIAGLAKYFGVSAEQIILRLQKPWGIEQLTRGELPDNKLARIQSDMEDRLDAALRLIYLGEQVCKNNPNQVKQLIWDIVTLTDNTMLIISKIKGQLMIRKKKLQGVS